MRAAGFTGTLARRPLQPIHGKRTGSEFGRRLLAIESPSHTRDAAALAHPPDGSCVLEVPFGDDRELVMDVLKYGPDCRVVEPAALRERVAKRARETAGIYMPMRPGGPGTRTRIG